MLRSRREFLAYALEVASGLAFYGCSSPIGGRPDVGQSQGPVQSGPARAWHERGDFLPVFDELSASGLKIVGEVPSELHGLYVRNGPNPLFSAKHSHWFDGDGMLHGVYLRDGMAAYTNRFIQTEGLLRERAAGRSLYGGYLAGPPWKNTANVSVLWHHGAMLANWEGDAPYQIEPGTLKTLGRYDFNGNLKQEFTGHPKVDPVTGELFYFGYRNDAKPFLRYGVADRGGKIFHSTAIELPRPVMIHDFAITERFAVFMDLPLLVSATQPDWQPRYGARIGVLPRTANGDAIRWFEVSPGWVYHLLNAHEAGDSVVVHACRRKEWAKPPSVLYRWSLNLKSGRVHEEVLDDRYVEAPIINPRYLGRAARFGYLARMGGDQAEEVLKFDRETGRIESYALGKGRQGGEFLFVPAAGSSREDGGYLLGFVYDENTAQSELLVLDAADFGAPLRARIYMPRRVPFGFHGAWLPGVEQSA